MMNKTIVHEKHYMITKEEYNTILFILKEHNIPSWDEWTYNLYLDNEYHDMLRCLNKPFYKEKYRFYSYDEAYFDKPIYFEQEKAIKNMVIRKTFKLSGSDFDLYKREKISRSDALYDELSCAINKRLKPRYFAAKHRLAFMDHNIHITFDDHILYCLNQNDLHLSDNCKDLLDDDHVIMKIERSSYPLWLNTITSQLNTTSYSEYIETLIKEIAGDLNVL